jgi:hypothetical protein
MKKSLFVLLVCCPALAFAQKKGIFNYIKKHPYFKLSPTVFFPVDGNITPAAFGTVGVRLNRYAAIGLSGGYFKDQDSAKKVIPIGIDVTVTDFNSKKIAPVFVGQLFIPTGYKPHSKVTLQGITTPPPFVYTYVYHYEYNTKGSLLFQLGAGMAIPVMKKNKLLITGSYSQFNTKTRINFYYHNHSTGRGHWEDSRETHRRSMWAFAVNWLF